MTSSHLDTTYDDLLASRDGLPWWPWVGNLYATTSVKTLIVGESIYRWQDADASFDKRYALKNGLRVTHHNHAMSLQRPSAYVRNIERAIFATSKPTDEQKQRLWTSVAYHNLVLEPMRTARHRPSERQFRAGWEELLDVCALLSVDQLLIYGVSSVPALRGVAEHRGIGCDIKKGARVGRCASRAGTIDLEGRALKLLFVRHPSTCFSWRLWGDIICKELVLPFSDPPLIHQGNAAIKSGDSH